ncbi:MAG: DNA polymerase I [Phycisphaerae bacterium]
MSRSLYVIDGHYQIYRAYYAPFDRLTSPTGEPTKATHAFCGMLFNLIRKRQPDHLVMVIDSSAEAVFRRDIFPDYKAQREPPPEDFAPQADRILAIVRAMGIPVLSLTGFEADDLMATITRQLAERDIDIFLVSRDKDLEQLISKKVSMYDAGNGETTDADALFRKKGFTPNQAIDIQTLTGDSVDNVPGVVGIGPKTALKLIKQYGSADAVLENADQLTPKLAQRVKAFADQIEITRQLVTLRQDVPLDFDLGPSRLSSIPVEQVRPIFKELGFNRLTEQLNALSPTGERYGETEAPAAVEVDTRGDYRLIDTREQLNELANTLESLSTFAFDTETTSLNPISGQVVGLSFSWKAGAACYIPIRASVGRTLPGDAVIQKLKPIFENPSIHKCGHNLKFDMLVLRQMGIKVAGASFDTMIASFLLDPLRNSHGLDALVRDLLGHHMIPISDLIGKGKNQTTMDQIDTQRVGEYASEDADYTWRLYEHLQPLIVDAPVRSVFENVEMPLVGVLVEMEHNGIAVDTDVLAKMSNYLADRLKELTSGIHQAAGHEFNIDSTRQLAQVLFDEHGLEVIRKTKTGRSTDAETLNVLAAITSSPIPKLVLEYRELTKLKGTYVDTLPEMIDSGTGRIHSSFHQTGAVTGRLSSSNPNMQNIPVRTETGRRIRAAFVAGNPDHVLLVADYSQIELRVLAHFCGDQTLQRAFHQGQDVHAFVAAQINGVNIAEVTKDQRSAAKAVNFGIIYGQTPFGLSRSLGIPVAEAKAFIDTYFMRYPGIRLFIDRCIEQARSQGYVETILGRRRPVEELKSRNRQRVAQGERLAVNTVIQGSAADLIKRAMIDIQKVIDRENRPSRMLLQVHDELVFEVPEAHVQDEAEMIREKMCAAIPLDVPIVVDVNWGVNWLESK